MDEKEIYELISKLAGINIPDKEVPIQVSLKDLVSIAKGCLDIGYEDGYDNGYEEGHDAGRNDGYDEGYDEGKLAGYDEGYEAGVESYSEEE
jgi:hypothetical protein